METVFGKLARDPRVAVNGSHWASRINAYGCVNRDLDQAIQVFNDISKTKPNELLRNTYRRPDAVVFEAMINVLVTHRRPDLFPEYIQRMAKLGEHMTAYIANSVIKGYAAVNDIEKAREIFESMSDPAFGVAAPDNHLPHEPSTANRVPFDAPVYREVGFQYKPLSLTTD